MQGSIEVQKHNISILISDGLWKTYAGGIVSGAHYFFPANEEAEEEEVKPIEAHVNGPAVADREIECRRLTMCT